MLQEKWTWIVGSLALLALIYWVFRRISLAYGRRVSKELDKFIEEPKPIVAPSSPPLPPLLPSDNEVLGNEKLKIWQNLHSTTLPAERLVEVLTHELAVARIDKIFSVLYFKIYRSQHVLLKMMAASGGSISRTEVEQYLAGIIAADEKLKDVQFDRWIGFLASENLVTATVTSIQLTSVGREFLVWVVRNQLIDSPHGF